MAVGAQVHVGDQLAGRHADAPSASKLVGAQEHLMRGMRRIGLVLVDERSGGVFLLVDVVGGAQDAVRRRMNRKIGGPRLDHEVGRAAAR